MLFRKGYGGYAAENKRPGQRTDAFCGLCHGGPGGGAAACEGRTGTGPPVFHCHDGVCASTTYHTVDSTDKVNRRLRKLDHMMIFVLIAGSYTPICLITLRGPQGTALCIAVWAVALAGIAIKALWITCPKWFSSVLYIAMGWLCVFAVVPIVRALSPAGFGWLLAGGIIYTAGGVIYALKLPLFNSL